MQLPLFASIIARLKPSIPPGIDLFPITHSRPSPDEAQKTAQMSNIKIKMKRLIFATFSVVRKKGCYKNQYRSV
jgi:hypothetical protein